MAFIDAQQMKVEYPYTFGAPTKQNLNKLKEGSLVKVCHNNERFWTKIQKIEKNKTLSFNDNITAIVDNDLICEQPFKLGDTIQFEKRHILCTMQE